MGMGLVINSSWLFCQNWEKGSASIEVERDDGVGSVIITRRVKVKGCQLFHFKLQFCMQSNIFNGT